MEIQTATQAMLQAYALASAQNEEILKRWIDISHRVGSRLHKSLLPNCFQDLGWLDILLRTFEYEFLLNWKCQNDINPVSGLPLFQFSKVWMCDAYEIFRLLKERKLESGESFDSLCDHLRLVRIPLDKHEIAGMPKDELRFQAHPPKPEDKPYVYLPKDPSRSHIMPVGHNRNHGSVAWHVTDVITDRENPSSYWIDRREISDRILSLWAPEEDDNPVST